MRIDLLGMVNFFLGLSTGERSPSFTTNFSLGWEYLKCFLV